MKQFGIIGLFLQPSVASFMFVILASIFIFGSTLLTLGGANDTMFRLLLGEESNTEFVASSKSTYNKANEKIFDNPIVNKVVFFSFWFFTGLVAYLIITSIASGISAAKELKVEDQLYNAPRNMLLQERRNKVAVRVAVFFGWVLYTILFFKVLLPYALLSFKIITNSTVDPSTALTGLIGFLVLAGALHLHVVALRFLLLKPRMFGGDDDLLAARLT